jgi:hypothetical protein
MKSPYKNIEINYWTYPDGKDFNGIEDFISEIDKDYFLTVTKKRTDALGGGLYDLIIEISEDLTLLELAKSYLEDGIKLYVGYNIKKIYESIKVLFEKNQDFNPTVEQIKIKFKDCTIYLYEVYQNGIAEAFDDFVKILIDLVLNKKIKFKKIKEIHSPIYNHRDSYDLCDYRVKLQYDENISEFKKADYLKFWGVKFKKKKMVYDVENGKFLKEKFYTQKAYDKLFEKKKE